MQKLNRLATPTPSPTPTSVEDLIESVCRHLREISTIVKRFDEQNQLLLFEKINGYFSLMKQLYELADTANASIPLEVLDLLDQGKNPDLFSKECLDKTMGSISRTKIKADSLQSLQVALSQELEKVPQFADLVSTSAPAQTTLSSISPLPTATPSAAGR
ncbi:putative mediator of RNA polymerase II transcription subunit 10 [Paratrimastix pyriformis]|uniref:Mediator of RNA polymerase II transcription subunit 10 n=1 Tax=Paratrimastix pyriformis TaxID=342808 RepID=A0ABQ8UBY9_9EUKA|nr:putative mediator of RNA polymerase II transcription subunit 10 [Paratrimastix pyriformis]